MQPRLGGGLAVRPDEAWLLLGHDLSVLAFWAESCSMGVTIPPIVLTAIADELHNRGATRLARQMVSLARPG